MGNLAALPVNVFIQGNDGACPIPNINSRSILVGDCLSPLPITLIVLGSKMPEGTTCSLNAPRSVSYTHLSQLNTYLRELLDSDEIVRDIWIEGEVSNFVRAASGHCYFTLKEGEAQIKSACWRTYVARIPAMPSNGDAVLAH